MKCINCKNYAEQQSYCQLWELTKQFDTKFEDADTQRRLCKRTSIPEATAHNNKKCRKSFISLGFEYKKRDNFEERLKLAIFKVRSESNKMIKREARNIQRLLACGE